MYREAIAEWLKGPVDCSGDWTGFSKSGYKGALQAWLDHLNSPSDPAYVSPLFIATIYARLRGRVTVRSSGRQKPVWSATTILYFLELNRLWTTFIPIHATPNWCARSASLSNGQASGITPEARSVAPLTCGRAGSGSFTTDRDCSRVTSIPDGTLRKSSACGTSVSIVRANK
jgi:hypothetical protein